MSLLEDAIHKAESLGHRLEYDEAHPLSSVNRHTCRNCGRAILSNAGNIYGSALTTSCAGRAGS